MADDPRDFSNKYNTPLSDNEQTQFNSWTSRQSAATGRDVSRDKYDYDLQGWWKENPGFDLSGGHLTDTYKKPNHPTFSDQSQYHGQDGNEGGQWINNPDGTYAFKPGATNMQMFHPDELNDYFSRVERGNQLIMPQSQPQQPQIDPKINMLMQRGLISPNVATQNGIM
jgi:hypothetical protein